MVKTVTFFILLCSSAMLYSHPFNVSITTIKCNSDENKMEITLRLFLDDIERHFEQSINQKMNYGTENENPQAIIELNKYINECFKIDSNKDQVKYTMLGNEIEDDVLWIYIESPIVEKNNLIITNTLLTDVFENQSNMINFECSSLKESVVLNRDEKSHAF